MRILNTAEMRLAEAAANERGVSYEQLMENAGQKAAQYIISHFSPCRIVFLCGKGNNAGDGLVMARLLTAKGFDCTVSFLCGESLSPLATLNRERLPKQVKQTVSQQQAIDACKSAELLVDGVFGIGFHGALSAEVTAVFETANRLNAHRIALDLPSGLNADTGEFCANAFEAHTTFTFGAYKPALTMEGCQNLCGKVVCFDIGL